MNYFTKILFFVLFVTSSSAQYTLNFKGSSSTFSDPNPIITSDSQGKIRIDGNRFAGTISDQPISDHDVEVLKNNFHSSGNLASSPRYTSVPTWIYSTSTENYLTEQVTYPEYEY